MSRWPLIVFDQQRAAAHKMGTDPRWYNKSTGDLPRLKPLKNWMQPLRERLKKLAVAAHCGLDRAKPGVPVVTYIDRCALLWLLLLTSAKWAVASLSRRMQRT